MSLRIAGAFRAGDLVRPGGFALGGVPAQDVAMSIVNCSRAGSTGYLRGYPSRTITGNQYHLANLEYRQELWLIEHGLASLPIYLRRVHSALLVDVGTAFDSTFDRQGPAARGRRRAAARRVLRLLRAGHVRDRLLARASSTAASARRWFLLTGSL